MDRGSFDKAQKRLRSDTPLVGSVMRRKAAEELIEDGSTDTVRFLAEAAAAGPSGDPPDAELDVLVEMAARGNHHARAAIAGLVIDHGHGKAAEIAVENQYAPRGRVQRTLFFFLTGQWDRYEEIDAGGELIRAAWQELRAAQRARVEEIARRTGRAAWLMRARVAEASPGGGAGEGGTDWETTISVHEAMGRWEDLFVLAQDAPAVAAAAILARLEKSGWNPGGENARMLLWRLYALARRVEGAALSAGGLAEAAVTIECPAGGMSCLAMSGDGRLLAGGGDDGSVCVWSLEDGSETARLQQRDPDPGWMRMESLAFTPDGRLLAGTNERGLVHAWSIPDGRVVRRMEGGVREACVSPDGRVLVCAGGESRLALWSLPDGKLIGKQSCHNREGIARLAMSPDGTLAASAGVDGTVWLWHLPDGSPVRIIKAHEGEARSVAFLFGGKALASGGKDGAAKIWSAPDGIEMASLSVGVIRRAYVFSADQRVVAAADARPALPHLRRCELAQDIVARQGSVEFLAWAPGAGMLVCGADGLYVWDLPEGRFAAKMHPGAGALTCLAMDPAGSLVASGTSGGDLFLYSLTELRWLRSLADRAGRGREVRHAAFTRDGAAIVTVHPAGSIGVWRSRLVRLARAPVSSLRRDDLEWAQAAQRSEAASPEERRWLDLLLALLLMKRRF